MAHWSFSTFSLDPLSNDFASFNGRSKLHKIGYTCIGNNLGFGSHGYDSRKESTTNGKTAMYSNCVDSVRNASTNALCRSRLLDGCFECRKLIVVPLASSQCILLFFFQLLAVGLVVLVFYRHNDHIK